MSKGSIDIVNPNSPATQERISALLLVAKIELVLCYGIRRNASERWSLFNEELRLEESTDMDVLIVIHQSDKHLEHELVERVNRLNTEVLRLVPVIHNADSVKKSVANCGRFFCSVFAKGVLIYQNTYFQRPEIFQISTAKTTTRFWRHHTLLADQFLAGAEFHFRSRQYGLSVFMLHQATERICCVLIQELLGYRVSTHSIDRILSLTECISVELSNVFPKSTKGQKIAFRKFCRSYSQARYDESFKITEEQARDLRDQVTALIKIATEIYVHHISQSNEKAIEREQFSEY
jgi:HEPN domain-containing protein